MECYQCGTKLPEGTKNCPACGRKLIFTARQVQAAIDGDQEAIAGLYNRTYNAVYQTVKSMIRDEDTVLDILQDAYVKGFQNLDRLKTPETFPAWIKQIARNTAKDWLKRKRPVLFSELENEDGDMTLDFEDDRTDNLPETVMDQKETSRLINEILDALSEEQRVVVGLFYYQQLSVKEIAHMLDCSENTVKSRLNYARKRIKAQVEDLERHGTKLYSLSPIPFMLWLFRGMKAQAAKTPAPAVLEAVQAEYASFATGGTAAGTKAGAIGTKAARTAGKRFATRIASFVMAVPILFGGALVISPAVTQPEPEPPLKIVEPISKLPASTEEPEETTPPVAKGASPVGTALKQYHIIVSPSDEAETEPEEAEESHVGEAETEPEVAEEGHVDETETEPEAAEESHLHEWTPVTATVHHDAVTEQVKVVDKEGTDGWWEIGEEYTVFLCRKCEAEFSSKDEVFQHYRDQIAAGDEAHDTGKYCYCARTYYPNRTWHEGTPEEYHYETYVVSGMWDETIITGYACVCGATM